jgi:PE-PPE domain
MRRSSIGVAVALLSGVLVTVSSTFAPVAALGATAALIMGGTGLSNPAVFPKLIQNVENYYLAPNSTCAPADCRLVSVVTPEGFLPPLIGDVTFGPSVAAGVLDLRAALQSQLVAHPEESVVIFGYSQSGDIVAKTLRNFAGDPASAPPTSQVSFVVIGDASRPNGGILARFPGLWIPLVDVTFDGAAPTDTGYATTDIAFQYDPIADFPQYPINILADLNALIGLGGVHATYANPYLPASAGNPFIPTALPDGYTPEELKQAMADPANRQTVGDTTYITLPTKTLPLLQPLLNIGAATGTYAVVKPIVDLIQPTLRVLIELGYDRTIAYGQPTAAGLLPAISLPKLVSDLTAAADQGITDALADLRATIALPAGRPKTAAKTLVPSISSGRTEISVPPGAGPAPAGPGKPRNRQATPSLTHPASRARAHLQPGGKPARLHRAHP